MDHSYPAFSCTRKSALVIAHPGHELRVRHWMELARPMVFVLTDGSGRSGKSRLPSTTRVLEQAGAQAGSIFGRMSDIELYRVILDQNFETIVELAEELAKQLYELDVERAAGDAIEGYNPAHDLCRLIINSAMTILKNRHRLSLENFDFLLSGRPDACSEITRNKSITLRLNDQDFETKLQAARSYPELRDQIENAINRYGLEAFRTECLRPVDTTKCCYSLDEPAFYERYGEKQVSAGFYNQVIRYREHMIPMAEALRDHAERFKP